MAHANPTTVPQHVDSGSTIIPITFDVDTTGMRKGKTVYKHIKPEHIIDGRVGHVDLLNLRSLSAMGHSDMGVYALKLYHQLPSKETPTGVPMLFTEHSSYTNAPSDHADTDLVNAPMIFHGVWSDHKQERTLVPTHEQQKKRAVSNLKKLSDVWRSYSDKDLFEGARNVELDGKPQHVIVTANDVTTKKQSPVYTLLSRNSSNPALLGGRYMGTKQQNPRIHTTARDAEGNHVHAYKMTPADFDEAVASLYDNLTTHSPMKDGFGIGITKLSDDLNLPVMRDGKPVVDEMGKQKFKTVDAITQRPVRRTLMHVTLTRQRMDPVLGFIPNEDDPRVMLSQTAAIGKSGAEKEKMYAPSGLEGKLYV